MWKDDPLELQKNLFKKVFYIALIPFFFTLFCGQFSSSLGLLIGLIVSFLLFRLRFINLNRALNMSKAKAGTFIRNHYFINYFIYFSILFVAYKNPKINFIATVIGLLILRYTIFGMALIDIIKDNWHKKLKTYEEGGNLDESGT